MAIDTISALLALTGLEIVLGIDNVVFIAILVSKLRKELQQKARLIGLSLAMMFRVLMLLGLSWLMKLEEPLLLVGSITFNGKSIILIIGGLFLIWKSTSEIHKTSEQEKTISDGNATAAGFVGAISQVVLVDLLFSIDSVVTAIGMAQDINTMIVAVILSVLLMMLFAGSIAIFIERHPTLKMLGLSFLLLIGVLLVADGFGKHLDRGYVYFAMGFSLFVEVLNIRARQSNAHH